MDKKALLMPRTFRDVQKNALDRPRAEGQLTGTASSRCATDRSKALYSGAWQAQLNAATIRRVDGGP